jgi:hypothetical protein
LEDAESTQNMYSNLAVKNKYDCLKLHHVGYLIKYVISLFHRAFLFTIFICSNKCAFKINPKMSYHLRFDIFVTFCFLKEIF